MSGRKSRSSKKKSKRGVLPKHGENLPSTSRDTAAASTSSLRGRSSRQSTSRSAESQQPRGERPAPAAEAAAPRQGVLYSSPPSQSPLLQFRPDELVPGAISVLPGPSVYSSNFTEDDRELARLRTQAEREYREFCDHRRPPNTQAILHPLALYLLDSSSDEDFDPEDDDDDHDWDLRALVKDYKPLRNLVFKGRYIGSRFGSLDKIEVDSEDSSIATFEDVGSSLSCFDTLRGKLWSGICMEDFPEHLDYIYPTIFAQKDNFPPAMYTGNLCKFRINHIDVHRKWNSPKGYEFGANFHLECLKVYDRH